MNHVCLIGNLVAEPDIQRGISKAGNNYVKASFTLAVNRNKAESDFVRIVCFDKTAEMVEKYFHKGFRMGLEGSLRTSSYTNKEGRKITTLDVMANHIDFPNTKSTNRDGSYTGSGTGYDENQAFEPFDDEDIIF